MSTRGSLSLATRGSDLARRQAGTVKSVLEDRRYDVELREIETTGDQIRDELFEELGTVGAFVRSLDEQVLDGTVDAAVHSMKDMPTEMPDELVLAAVPERGPRSDVLITPEGTTLDALPPEAVVGTSSLRRRAQLKSERPDLQVEPLRGNVDTRVKKLLAPQLQAEHERRLAAAEDDDDTGDSADTGDDDTSDAPEFDRTPQEWFDDLAEIERQALEQSVETEYDAIVLSEAGLRRSGLLQHLDYQRLPWGDFVPAPGQATIAVTAADESVIEILQSLLDDPVTRVETIVERTILAELGGGCVAPIGITALVQGAYVHTAVQVLSRDGQTVIDATRDLPIERHRAAAREFATTLREQGAQEIIAQATRTSDRST